MKVINTNRFFVKTGDYIIYNDEAIKYMNKRLITLSQPLWPSAEELNKKNPKVSKFKYVEGFFEKKLIELWVSNDGGYTGLSGVINGIFVDIWVLNIKGGFEFCPYPLFLRRKLW